MDSLLTVEPKRLLKQACPRYQNTTQSVLYLEWPAHVTRHCGLLITTNMLFLCYVFLSRQSCQSNQQSARSMSIGQPMCLLYNLTDHSFDRHGVYSHPHSPNTPPILPPSSVTTSMIPCFPRNSPPLTTTHAQAVRFCSRSLDRGTPDAQATRIIVPWQCR